VEHLKRRHNNQHNDTQYDDIKNNGTWHNGSVVMPSFHYAECPSITPSVVNQLHSECIYAECRYAGCRGAFRSAQSLYIRLGSNIRD
jgi:hypothetical protein